MEINKTRMYEIFEQMQNHEISLSGYVFIDGDTLQNHQSGGKGYEKNN